MSLQYNPFSLIFTRGDEPVKLACLEFFGLGDTPKAQKILSKLIEQQRSDGAFPSRTDSSNWGIVETVRNSLHLLKAGLNPDEKVIKKAVEFILRKQCPDGGWSENKALQIPEDQVEMSNQQPVTWLTADTVELLHRIGKDRERECKKAIEWLRKTQNKHGGWYCFEGSIGDKLNTRGDPDSTAQIAFLMGKLLGEDDPIYLKGKKLFENYLNEALRDVKRGYWIRLRDGKKEKLDAYHLTHLFLSWTLDPPRRFQSGYDISDSRVKEIMNALIDMQNSDGGWRPFWSEESSPTYTFIAVKVLILSKMLSKGNTKNRLIAEIA